MASNTTEFTHPRWDEMWTKGIQPGQAFDANCPSPLLVKLKNEGLIPSGKALIPGCGRGYDVTLLASENRVAIGLEIAPLAVEAAKQRLENLTIEEFPYKHNAHFHLQSFFDIMPKNDEEKFDFIYDYTFLCALDPSVREDWARQMANLVKPNGILLTLIFPINVNKVGGPPFAVSLEGVKGLLEPVGFECLELDMLPSELSHPNRDGSEGGHGASGVGRWRRIP
eukprot:gene6220-6694_t